MNLKKKENIVIIVILVIMILAIIGVSYAAFNFSKQGNTLNKITTGSITMTYTESSNTISLGNALPTTDTTGYKRLKEGEYFDFSVTSNIQGYSYINYEISAKEVGDGTIDGKYIKLYLSKINDDGTETPVTPIQHSFNTATGEGGITGVPTYNEEKNANDITGRPAGEMSLTSGTAFTEGEVTTNYRLRMWVSEDYNPQGDGGGLNFTVQVNVYGKNEAGPYPLLKPFSAGFNEDFRSSEYKEKITSIVTKGDTDVPNDVIATFDLSSAHNNSVIGYLEDDGRGTGTYKLTIGADGMIIGNPDMSNYFRELSKLETVDFSYLDTINVTNMYRMFYECSSLKEIDLSLLDTSNVTNMSLMFSGCSSLKEIDLSSLNTLNVTDMSGVVYGCSSLTNVNFGNINTLNVTNMSGMFQQCSSLKEIDLSSLATINVTSMRAMFMGCSSLTNVNFGNINTTNVTDMAGMFSGCSSLVTIDLDNFDTLNVIYMNRMFERCSNLIDLDLDNFNTSNVTNMSEMFSGCSSLTELDLSNFDTSNVKNMGGGVGEILNDPNYGSGMFGDCINLTKLDLRNFDTHNVTSMFAMFYNTPKLSEVLVSSKWVVNSGANTNYMFDSSGVSSVTYE